MPLTLLLTRPHAQADRFAMACRARLGGDVDIMISPVLGIEFIGTAPDLSRFRGVILTSENGVRALAERTDPSGRLAHCVGRRTADVAERHGMATVVHGGTAADLVEDLMLEQGPFLHVRGAHARGDVAARLTAAGVQTDEAVLYNQVPHPLSAEARAALAGRAPVLLPLFSPRSAALVGAAAMDATAPLSLAAMSAAVLGAWSGPEPVRHAIAARPEADAMLDALAGLAAAASP